MSITWQFYADAGLTIALDPVAATQVQAGDPSDVLVYFGSTTADKQLQSDTDPGTNAVQLTIYDTASGSGLAAATVTTALSYSELGTNTPGAALSLGVTLLSGAINAVPVYLRFDGGAAAIGAYTDLQFRVSAVESAA